MSKELVSVILPCYNVQEYVERAIDSVVNQTYSNIEVVAVNDGSTDDTLAVLDNLRTRFANLVVINQKNQGYGTAVQTGINHAKGTYVVFWNLTIIGITTILNHWLAKLMEWLQMPFFTIVISRPEITLKRRSLTNTFMVDTWHLVNSL